MTILCYWDLQRSQRPNMGVGIHHKERVNNKEIYHRKHMMEAVK